MLKVLFCAERRLIPLALNNSPLLWAFARCAVHLSFFRCAFSAKGLVSNYIYLA